MAAIDQERLKRVVSAILLLPVAAGFIGASFFLIKDAIGLKFDAFGLFVWVLTGAALAVIVNNIKTRT